jgi:kanamycin kinase
MFHADGISGPSQFIAEFNLPFDLPEAVAHFIADAALIADEIGESPCHVHHFTRGNDRFFLKTSPAVYAPTTYSVLREARVLDWLSGRLAVPEVVLAASTADGEFMITRAVPGESLAARIAAGRPVVELFRDALHRLQAMPANDCPFDSGVEVRLRELAYLLDRGLAADDCDLDRWPGIAEPRDLLEHLEATRPTEDLVFSHGDLCDNNVFVDDRDNLHFIDLGRGGRADRWADITLVLRNLRDDISDEAAAAFLTAIGKADDGAKRTFFEQLDELF